MTSTPVRILEAIGIGVLLLFLAVLALFVRRAVIARSGGVIALQVRLSTVVPGRGWSPGFARFVDDELRWYRMFSLAPRPRRVLSRRSLVIDQRRAPDGPERLNLPGDGVILRCVNRQVARGGAKAVPLPIEIAMATSTVTGFLSWLEAAPPGAAPSRISNR